jgi:uncharacterized protein
MNIERRIAPVHLELRADGRTLVGTLVPYGQEARIGKYTEKFVYGAFADAEPVPLLAVHNHENLPLGLTRSLTETPSGLEAELRVSQTTAGDEALTLVRDGALSGLSIGFLPITDKWNAMRTVVERIKAKLVEVSLTSFPAYESARIMALRADQEPVRTPRLTIAHYL